MFAEALIYSPAEIQEFKAIVDTDRYPAHDPEHPRYKDLPAECRAGLDKEGCAHVADFLRPLARDESNRLAKDAFYSRQRVNPYFTEDDPSLEPDHPRRWFMDRTSGFVTLDQFPETSVIRRLYFLIP